MPTTPNTAQTMADAEAMIARARQGLADAEGLTQRHSSTLRSQVREQLQQAQLQPVLPGTDIAIDPATVFARQVRRRRVLV